MKSPAVFWPIPGLIGRTLVTQTYVHAFTDMIAYLYARPEPTMAT